MGHKVHPKIHRTPVTYGWDSKWFAKKNDYAKVSLQDLAIRNYIEVKCKNAHIDSMSIERGPKNVTVTILAGKPGFIIGRQGQGLDDIRKHIERKITKMEQKVKLNVREVYSPALSASIVGQVLASDIERRIPFRRTMKQSIERVMNAQGQGVKISVAGRLNGSEIARTETLSAGKVPLITIRSDVDYARVEANTIYGKIGIKVWIYKGELFAPKDKFKQEDAKETQKRQPSRRPRSPRK